MFSREPMSDRSWRLGAVGAALTAVACLTSVVVIPIARASVDPTRAAVPTGFDATDLDDSGDTVPDTNYAEPTNAIYMATNGDDDYDGSSGAPVATLNAALAKAKTVGDGATIVVRGGVYRDWFSNGTGTANAFVLSKVTIQAAPHAQVWFDGTDLQPGPRWNLAAGLWSMHWSTPSFCDGKYYERKPTEQSRIPNNGPCSHFDTYGDPGNPLAGDPQMVFVNGTALHQVASKAEVAAGTFFYDWGAQQMYIAVNPNTAVVELAARPVALVLGDNGTTSAANSTIRGIGFRRYATNNYENSTQGAVYVGGTVAGVSFENDVFTGMAGAGLIPGARSGRVVHSVFVGNGYNGIIGNGSQTSGATPDRLQVLSNVMSRNNTEHFDTTCKESCGAAGIKLSHMNGVTIRSNIVQGNIGSAGGIWCDLSCSKGVIVNNLVTDNGTAGINYEVSDTGVIASNLVARNGSANGAVGIFVVSANTAVYNNTLVGNVQGVGVTDDNRTNDNGGIAPNTSNVRMANNIIVGTNYALKAEAGSEATPSDTGPDQFFSFLDYDAYYQPNPNLSLVYWRTQAGGSTGYQNVPFKPAATQWETHGYAVRTTTDPDPFFVDAGHGNYTVRSDSAAYRSGAPLPADVAAAVGLATGAVLDRGAIDYVGQPVVPSTPGAFVSVPAAKLLDTRSGVGGTTGPVGSNSTTTLQVAGRAGIATGASAALVDISVLNPTTNGVLTAYPAGTTRPIDVSQIAPTINRVTTNRAMVALGTNGAMSIWLYLPGGGTTDLLVTVTGYVIGGTPTTPGAYVPATPGRFLDTRAGTGAPVGPVAGGSSLAVQVGGVGGVPTTGVAAVVVNLLAVNATAVGSLTAVADGVTRKGGTSLPLVDGLITQNMAVVPVSASGKISLYVSAGSTDLVGDVFGYVRSGSVSTSGNIKSLTLTRAVNTRNGVGGTTGPIGANGTLTVTLAGTGGVPADGAAAVIVTMTVSRATAAGSLTAWAGATSQPSITDLGFQARETAGVLAVIPLGADGTVSFRNSSSGTVDLTVDVEGYVRSG